jgi:hypothetical protein
MACLRREIWTLDCGYELMGKICGRHGPEGHPRRLAPRKDTLGRRRGLLDWDSGRHGPEGHPRPPPRAPRLGRRTPWPGRTPSAAAAGSSTGTADAMAQKDTLGAWRRRPLPEKWEVAGDGFLMRARREQSIGGASWWGAAVRATGRPARVGRGGAPCTAIGRRRRGGGG